MTLRSDHLQQNTRSEARYVRVICIFSILIEIIPNHHHLLADPKGCRFSGSQMSHTVAYPFPSDVQYLPRNSAKQHSAKNIMLDEV